MRFIARLQFLFLIWPYHAVAVTKTPPSPPSSALPRSSVTPTPTGADQRLILTINDRRQLLDHKQPLRLIRGDRLSLEGMTGGGRDWTIRALNLGKDLAKPANLLGRNIDTTSIPEPRETAAAPALQIMKAGREWARVSVILLEPQFQYAVIRLNGQQLVLKDQETLRVLSTDRYKVERIVTNLPELDADVTYDVQAVAPATATDPFQRYQLRFKRNGRPFGSIPLEVTERF